MPITNSVLTQFSNSEGIANCSIKNEFTMFINSFCNHFMYDFSRMSYIVNILAPFMWFATLIMYLTIRCPLVCRKPKQDKKEIPTEAEIIDVRNTPDVQMVDENDIGIKIA